MTLTGSLEKHNTELHQNQHRNFSSEPLLTRFLIKEIKNRLYAPPARWRPASEQADR